MATQKRSSKPWNTNERPSPGRLDNYVRLAAAIMARAAKEAQRGDYGAAAWLQGDTAGMFADALGLDRKAIARQAASWAANPAGALVIKCYLEA